MLSRRNIRVKVMQTLYLLESSAESLIKAEEAARGSKIDDKEAGAIILAEGKSRLLGKFEQSRRLLAYLVYFLTEVARYAEKEAARKAGKFLPTEGDLSVNTKIAGNTLLWQILEENSFQSAVKEFHFESVIDADLVRKIYNNLASTAEYKEYTEFLERNKKSEKGILDIIFNQLMLPDDLFIGHMEELFINWDDDAEMMQALVANFLNKPVAGCFHSVISEEKKDFGIQLLRTVLEKKEILMELIKPRLKNWDAERIAALDMILLRMGVSEFLFFETIPTKVTINEYIDLAKEYSTPQSGQFVNGLLDSIHKDLSAEGKIVKKAYKNSTL